MVSVDGTDKLSAVMSTTLFSVAPAPPDDTAPVTLLEPTERLNVPPAASLMFSNELQLKPPLLPAFCEVRLYVAPLPVIVSLFPLAVTLLTPVRIPPIPVVVPAAPERLKVTGAA